MKICPRGRILTYLKGKFRWDVGYRSGQSPRPRGRG
jgi:hypothetical protein